MKNLILLTWVLIQAIVPTMAVPDLYITGVQLELALFATGVWYFNKIYSKKGLNVILGTFALYYLYILVTDQFISYMPYNLVLIESFVIFIILWLQLRHEE